MAAGQEVFRGENEPPDAPRLREHWTRLGPLRFPTWTSSVIVAWFPVSVAVAGAVGATAGERAGLVTLAALLLGFFLVLGAWVTTGSSLWSLLGTALAALIATALSIGLLVGVSAIGEIAAGDAAAPVPRGMPGAQLVQQAELDDAVLAGADLDGVDVSGLDLSRRDLVEVQMDGAVGVDTEFVGSWLREGSLRGAVLTGADFTGACLADLDLTGASLTGATFLGADTRGAEVDPAEVARARSWPTDAEAAASNACAAVARPAR